jgi:hypothetical protein
MFSVYGKSKVVARKIVGKMLSNDRSEINIQLREMIDASQSEKQGVIDQLVNDVYQNMKQKRCTHEFSAPEFAIEAFELMKKDTDTFSDLTLMKKVNKINKEGKVMASKATGKPLMEWVSINKDAEVKKAA